MPIKVLGGNNFLLRYTRFEFQVMNYEWEGTAAGGRGDTRHYPHVGRIAAVLLGVSVPCVARASGGRVGSGRGVAPGVTLAHRPLTRRALSAGGVQTQTSRRAPSARRPAKGRVRWSRYTLHLEAAALAVPPLAVVGRGVGPLAPGGDVGRGRARPEQAPLLRHSYHVLRVQTGYLLRSAFLCIRPR